MVFSSSRKICYQFINFFKIDFNFPSICKYHNEEDSCYFINFTSNNILTKVIHIIHYEKDLKRNFEFFSSLLWYLQFLENFGLIYNYFQNWFKISYNCKYNFIGRNIKIKLDFKISYNFIWGFKSEINLNCIPVEILLKSMNIK